MFYVSQLRNKRVWDAWGAPVGRCADLLVGNLEQAYPALRALVVHDGEEQYIAADQVSGLYPSIILTVPRSEIAPYAPDDNDLWLIDRVLDRQIVDTDGRRVVRVNDLQIARVRDRFCLTGVDVGARGLLRRLGVDRPVNALLRRLGQPLPKSVIPWEDVAPLQQQDPLRLRISKERISRLPPADIAAILDDLDRQTSEALITSLDDETLADALEEVPVALQMAVVAHLEPERAADILGEMGPDEAADVLADLPAETSEQLVGLMAEEDAMDVRHLLGYPVDSAGGIMTTEFATVPAGLRAGEALEHLRRSPEAQEDEAMYDVYVVDEAQHLRGVIRLRDLVMAPPDSSLEAWLDHDPISVEAYATQDQVGYLVAKYDLLSVPVVDEEGTLLGIVTVDDAIDAALPTAWKKRIPRFFQARRWQ